MKTTVKKEMKKLSRIELLEIIYAMKENEENLQSMLTSAQEKLEKREVLIDNAGSIAEASLAVNDVFVAAQRAADTYVESVKARYSNIEEQCAEAEAQRQKLLNDAKAQADEIIKDAKIQSAKMIEDAKSNVKELEKKFRKSVKKTFNSKSELKELLNLMGDIYEKEESQRDFDTQHG